MKVTFCRTGNYPRLNFKNRGCFTREFNSLEELAKFIRDNNCILHCPNLINDIGKKNVIILNKKYRSLYK